MLVFPALSDRLIVLASGLILAGGLAILVNMVRARSDRARGEDK